MVAAAPDSQPAGPKAASPAHPPEPGAEVAAPGATEATGSAFPDFLSNPDRDAWKAIRGFVYQVDLTILRWLALSPNEVLELERGEDIDIVATDLLAAVRQGRQLEQVKTSAKGLSIRSRQIVEMIANARLHLDANPKLPLLFRFTSNGHAAKERQLVKGSPPRACLVLWEELRRGAVSDAERPELLKWIRAGLDSVKQPAGLGDDQWQAFLRVRGSDDAGLREIIERLEWSLGQPDVPQLRHVLLDKIAHVLTHGDKSEAQSVYRALFEHTLSVLVVKGLKRLTSADLAPASESGRLGHGVHERLAALFRLTDLHEQRLTGLEDTLGRVAARLTGVEGDVASIMVGSDQVSLAVPPSPQPLSRRVKCVTDLGSLIAQRAWVHVTGPIGSGKSELAKRVCSEWPTGRALWLPLRGLSEGDASRRLDAATAQLVPEVRDPLERCKQLWVASGRGTIFVLNDRPGS